VPFWSWSKNAGSNDIADPTINWAEGQAPGTVNNSARAMMAALAAFRDDIGAANVTTAASTATSYVLNSSGNAIGQPYTSLSILAGKLIAFVPNVSNGTPCVLNVDGLGAKPLRNAPGIELVNGQCIQGTPYIVSYNNTDGAFYLYNIPAVGAQVPLGVIMPYSASTAPSSSYAMCNGQALPRGTYSALFNLLSSGGVPIYGSGIGGSGSTFGIPDLRGRVIAGIDANVGGMANRITSLVTDTGTINGTTLNSTGGSQTHALGTAEVGVHSHTQQGTFSGTMSGLVSGTGSGTITGSTTATHTHGGFQVPSGLVATVTSGAGVPVLGQAAGATGAPSGGETVSGTCTLSSLSVNLSGGATSTTISGNTQNNTGGNSIAWLQPTIILPFIIRVL
jgi:microcystin-dependent protein